MNPNSQHLFERAKAVIPGGVNSPVRSFGSVGGEPIFFERASGCELFSSDGKAYIDYIGSWGPMILGHQHPSVMAAVEGMLSQMTSVGATTPIEVAMAETLVDLIPSLEKVRMVNSGTEATMSAIRLARGYTNRPYFIKFDGCYHGHGDALLVNAGSGLLTHGHPSSAGVPDACVQHTITLPYNDVPALKGAFEQYPDAIAAVILEPVCGNMNCVLPEKAFMEALRELTEANGSVLIFDEVMTGFRVSLLGAQGLYGVVPDLSTFGKIIGGGFPVGCFGGKAEIMDCLSPLGGVYQAGTLSGNPIAMSAGLATLTELQNHPEFYVTLAHRTEQLALGLTEVAQSKGFPLLVQWVPGMFGLFCTDKASIKNLEDVKSTDIEQFNRLFHALLAEGIYIGPSAYEACFLSIQHTESVIEQTITAFGRAIDRL